MLCNTNTTTNANEIKALTRVESELRLVSCVMHCTNFFFLKCLQIGTCKTIFTASVLWIFEITIFKVTAHSNHLFLPKWSCRDYYPIFLRQTTICHPTLMCSRGQESNPIARQRAKDTKLTLAQAVTYLICMLRYWCV